VTTGSIVGVMLLPALCLGVLVSYDSYSFAALVRNAALFSVAVGCMNRARD